MSLTGTTSQIITKATSCGSHWPFGWQNATGDDGMKKAAVPMLTNTIQPYLLSTHEPLQILVNTKLVTPHDIQKAKTLLTSYKKFTKNILPEQQIIWDAVEPKKGKKNAYIPNSVWASKERMKCQQCYIIYGDALEPEETFKNIQYKYPKGDTHPKAARGMPTMHLPSGTCRQGAASLCIMPFQHRTCHPEHKLALPLQTARGRNTKL